MISNNEFKRIITRLNGFRGTSTREWKLAGDSLRLLASEGSSLSLGLRAQATTHALRIYLSEGIRSYSGGAAWTLLKEIGTADALMPLLEWLLGSRLSEETAKHGLQAIEKIFEREKGLLSESTLTSFSHLETIPAQRPCVRDQFERDEVRETTWELMVLDCSVLRELAKLEIARRTKPI